MNFCALSRCYETRRIGRGARRMHTCIKRAGNELARFCITQEPRLSRSWSVHRPADRRDPDTAPTGPLFIVPTVRKLPACPSSSVSEFSKFEIAAHVNAENGDRFENYRPFPN